MYGNLTQEIVKKYLLLRFAQSCVFRRTRTDHLWEAGFTNYDANKIVNRAGELQITSMAKMKVKYAPQNPFRNTRNPENTAARRIV